MIPLLIRNIVSAGTAAVAAIAFSRMDANPSLFLYEKLFVTDAHLDKVFQGKTIWITGASSGIGAELSIQLSKHGANLILSSRSENKLQSVAESCRRQQHPDRESTVTLLPMDLSEPSDELESKIDTLEEIVGSNNLDCVILNAGSGQLAPAVITDHSTTEEIFQINALAPIAITQSLLRRRILKGVGEGERQQQQQLVVTSSVGAKFGVPLSASYAASKHALHGYYDSLAAECPWLRIDLICPGPIETNFHNNHIGQGTSRMPKDNFVMDSSKTTTTSQSQKAVPRELKMPLERCVRLMISSISMQGAGREFWIAEQPTLVGMYIRQFSPTLFNVLLKKIGPRRIQAWEEGKNLYDPETWKASRKIGKEKKETESISSTK